MFSRRAAERSFLACTGAQFLHLTGRDATPSQKRCDYYTRSRLLADQQGGPRRQALQHDQNLTTEQPSFVTHLECASTGKQYAADQVHNLSDAGKPVAGSLRFGRHSKGVQPAESGRSSNRPVALSRAPPGATDTRYRQPGRADDARSFHCAEPPLTLASAKFS